jgi:hypothetical protein
MARAITKIEARRAFIGKARSYANYWASLEGATDHEKCLGLVHSIFVMFDGGTDLPSMNISLCPHPSDKETCEEDGVNWFEPDMIINDDCQLHEILNNPEK